MIQDDLAIPSARAGAVDALVLASMERTSIPGAAVAAIRRGVVVHHAAYGLASLELDVPAHVGTVFPLASITKLFTATLAMRRVEDGTLVLDEPIARHVDGLPEAWRPITARQVLSHTSGLPDVIADPMAGVWLGATRDAALAAAAALPMAFEPGTAWAYNQTGFVLLGAVVERLGGQPLAEQLAGSILGPLGLASTTFGDSSAIVAGRGPWYSRLDLSGPVPRLAERIHATWVAYPEVAAPCAGLNATALDLARFVDAVAAGRLLAPATVDAMWRPQTLRDGTPAGMDPTTLMGLGWIVEVPDGRVLVGGSGGATAAVRHDIAGGLTVAVLTNCQGSDPDGLATAVVRHLLGTGAA